MTEHKSFELTRDEADKLLRSLRGKGTIYFARIRSELPIAGEPGKCFPGYALLRVSLADAQRVASDLLSPTLEGRGGRVQIEINEGKYVYIG